MENVKFEFRSEKDRRKIKYKGKHITFECRTL